MSRSSCGGLFGALLLPFVAMGTACDRTDIADLAAPFTVRLDTSFVLPYEVRTSLTWVDPTHVALLDADQKQLVLIGLDGTVRRAGGPGKGPGEYQTPLQVVRASSGDLLVFDPQARQIQWLDRTLRPVRVTPTPHLANGILGDRGDALMMLWQHFPPDSLGREIGAIRVDGSPMPGSWRLGVFDPVFNEVAELEPGQLVQNPEVTLRSDGVIVLGESRDYRIWLAAQDGTILARGGRPTLPAEESPETSEAEIQRRLAEARRVVHDPEMLKEIEKMFRRRVSDARYKFRHLAVDDARRLWVLGDRGSIDSTEVDLFDADLSYLGTLPLLGELWAIAVNGGRMATLSGTPADEPWVLSFYTLSPTGS